MQYALGSLLGQPWNRLWHLTCNHQGKPTESDDEDGSGKDPVENIAETVEGTVLTTGDVTAGDEA